MLKHRGRLEIIADILNVAREGARKTRIMGFANLSFKLLEKYLPETIQLGFMHFSNDIYEITEKGHAFLEKYDDFSNRFSKANCEFRKMLSEKEALEKLCELETKKRPKLKSKYVRSCRHLA